MNSDYGFFYTNSGTGVTDGSNILWTQGLISGGITFPASVVTVATTGNYMIMFGYAVTLAGSATAYFELVINGVLVGVTGRLSSSATKAMTTMTGIYPINGTETVALQNRSGATRTLVSVSSSVDSFLTIKRL